MDIFGVLSFVGGLAMFLYGMSAMGDGLTKLSGGKLEYLLEKLTSKRIMAGLFLPVLPQLSSPLLQLLLWLSDS